VIRLSVSLLVDRMANAAVMPVSAASTDWSDALTAYAAVAGFARAVA